MFFVQKWQKRQTEMNQVGFKNAASGFVKMVHENWLLILSAGVLYCEIRNLRQSIEEKVEKNRKRLFFE